MATIENTYVGDGTTVLYSFTFPYIEETDVKVSLDDLITTEYTFANATTIEFDNPPANGVAISIFRQTSYEDVRNVFYPGSAIRSRDLNDNFTQSLYVVQEAAIDSSDALLTSEQALSTAQTANSNSTAAQAAAAQAAVDAAKAATDAASANAVQIGITPVYNIPGDDQSGIKNLETSIPLDTKGGVTLPFAGVASWEQNGAIRYNDTTNKLEIYDVDESTWVNASSGSEVSVTPPSPAVTGDVWYDPDTGRSYVYYTDSDSSQWVEMNPSWNGSIADGTVTTPKIVDGSVTPAKLDRTYAEATALQAALTRIDALEAEVTALKGGNP